MRLFSVINTALQLSFPYRDAAIVQTVDFGHDPNDSSIVRMRITPPAPTGADISVLSAIEIEFDRNGRERSRRLWPMKYQAWDSRDPALIEEDLARAAEAASEDDEAETLTPAVSPKGKHGQGK